MLNVRLWSLLAVHIMWEWEKEQRTNSVRIVCDILMIHKNCASAVVSLPALLMSKHKTRVSWNLTLFTYVPQASFPFGNLALKKRSEWETKTFINELEKCFTIQHLVYTWKSIRGLGNRKGSIKIYYWCFAPMIKSIRAAIQRIIYVVLYLLL